MTALGRWRTQDDHRLPSGRPDHFWTGYRKLLGARSSLSPETNKVRKAVMVLTINEVVDNADEQ